MSMKDHYHELERVCRIITEQKVDKDELPLIKEMLKSTLMEIAETRQQNAVRAELMRKNKLQKSRNRFYD